MSERDESQQEKIDLKLNSDVLAIEKTSFIKTVFKFAGLLLAACLSFSLFGGTLYILTETLHKKDENWLDLIVAFMFACFYIFGGASIGLVCIDLALEMFGLWKSPRQKIRNIFEKINNILIKFFKRPFSWLEKFFKIVLSGAGYLILFIGWLIALGLFLCMIYGVVWVIGYIFGQGFRST